VTQLLVLTKVGWLPPQLQKMDAVPGEWMMWRLLYLHSV